MSNTLTIQIKSLEQSNQDDLAAIAGDTSKQGNFHSFVSVELFDRIMTANRWRILEILMKEKRLGVRELARILNKDVSGVHRDVKALTDCGLVDRDGDGALVFEYDDIHVDFRLQAAS